MYTLYIRVDLVYNETLAFIYCIYCMASFLYFMQYYMVDLYTKFLFSGVQET